VANIQLSLLERREDGIIPFTGILITYIQLKRVMEKRIELEKRGRPADEV
jgi:hypothetical protein